MLGSLSLDALVVKHRASTYFWRLEHEVKELSWPAQTIVVVDRALEPSRARIAVVVCDDEFVLARMREGGFWSLEGERLLPQSQLWGVVSYVIQEVS